MSVYSRKKFVTRVLLSVALGVVIVGATVFGLETIFPNTKTPVTEGVPGTVDWHVDLDPSGVSVNIWFYLDDFALQRYGLFKPVQSEIESMIRGEINSSFQKTYNVSVQSVSLSLPYGKARSIWLSFMLPGLVEHLGNDTYLCDFKWRSLCINGTVDHTLRNGTRISWNLADTFNFSRLQTPLEQWEPKSLNNYVGSLELSVGEIDAAIGLGGESVVLYYSGDTIIFYYKPSMLGHLPSVTDQTIYEFSIN